MRLCPWADVVYGCDGPWWDHWQRTGANQFHGVKLAHDTGVCANYRDVHKIEVRDHDKMLFDLPGEIGSGGNSGFQALNIAAQFGADHILLVGFDMHGAAGQHWYGTNAWKNANNPADNNYVHWRAAMTKQARVLAGMGIEIVNASFDSALTCFERKSIEDSLRDWRL